MTKVALITDTHWGLKGGDENFLFNMDIFLDIIFFPELHERGITNVIHLGDLVHDRKRIGFSVLSHLKSSFLTPLQEKGIEVKMIIGNHDMPFRDVAKHDACTELLYGYDNVEVFTEVAEIPEWNMIMIPWLTKTNRESTLTKIAQSKMKYALGHLELSGFNFSKVQTSYHGDDPQNFSKFDHVFSGHYHYRHSKDNIHYLGSPTEQTWVDVNTTRGFHIFDTETGELEFIENPYNIFENVKFGDDSFKNHNHPRYYRLYVEGDEKQSDVDKVVKELQSSRALKVEVIGKRRSVAEMTESVEDSNDLNITEDTPTFIRSYVKEESVADVLVNLYNRAIVETT